MKNCHNLSVIQRVFGFLTNIWRRKNKMPLWFNLLTRWLTLHAWNRTSYCGTLRNFHARVASINIVRNWNHPYLYQTFAYFIMGFICCIGECNVLRPCVTLYFCSIWFSSTFYVVIFDTAKFPCHFWQPEFTSRWLAMKELSKSTNFSQPELSDKNTAGKLRYASQHFIYFSHRG